MIQSRLIAVFPFLMHAGWTGFIFYDGIKFILSYLFLLFWGGAFSSVAWPTGVSVP